MADRHHHGDDSGRRYSDLSRAVREADKLINVANELNLAGNLLPGERGINARGDDDDDENNDGRWVDDSHRRRHRRHDGRQLRTSSDQSNRELQEAFEERLVEVAIANALKVKPASAPVQKKSYQARYEITQFDGNDLPTQVINFGPTIITTRRNQVLFNTQPDDVMPFFTAGDYLDANRNGEPDIVEALVKFRHTQNPAEYLRVLRNRAVKAVVRGPATVRGSIELINIIVLEGRFSVTNQLVSNCFAATSDPEFVFETIVGAAGNQNGTLTSNPTQKTDIMLMGSTALNENDATFNTANSVKNVFFQNGAFVESPPSIGLYLNLFDRYIPGADVIVPQGRVLFGPCQAFNYFQ